MEVHREISGEVREDASRVGSRTDAPASIGEFGTISGRSSQQCLGAPAQQSPSTRTDGRHPEEEIRRLRELQHEQVAGHETEESRAKKDRILFTPALDLTPLDSGAAGSRSTSDLMQNLINAADSTLKEVRNV